MAETVPPLTVADIERDLQDKSFAVYLYIGESADAGWENAEIAFGLIPRLRIYLVKDRDAVANWAGDGTPTAIVFGWDDQVAERLDRDQASNLKTVIKSIQRAMKS